LGDLRALHADTPHQTLLVENEGVDVALNGRGGEGLGKALVDGDDTGAYANLEAATLVEITQRRLGHEEHGIAERLDTRLKAVGDGGDVVVPGWPTLLEKLAVAVLSAENEASLDDVREDENTHRLRPKFFGSRNALIENFESCFRFAVHHRWLDRKG